MRMTPWSDCLFLFFYRLFRVDRLLKNLNKNEWILSLYHITNGDCWNIENYSKGFQFKGKRIGGYGNQC